MRTCLVAILTTLGLSSSWQANAVYHQPLDRQGHADACLVNRARIACQWARFASQRIDATHLEKEWGGTIAACHGLPQQSWSQTIEQIEQAVQDGDPSMVGRLVVSPSFSLADREAIDTEIAAELKDEHRAMANRITRLFWKVVSQETVPRGDMAVARAALGVATGHASLLAQLQKGPNPHVAVALAEYVATVEHRGPYLVAHTWPDVVAGQQMATGLSMEEAENARAIGRAWAVGAGYHVKTDNVTACDQSSLALN